MLSDRERAELDAIERALVTDDRRLAATFRSGPPRRERRWPLRALAGFGVFLLVVAVLTGTAGLFGQGLLCLAIWFGWRRWRTLRARGADRAEDADPQRRARPDGSPPGWFRPV
jgi:protein-S-isoprenylcysteine O-methyltransferase Ste14